MNDVREGNKAEQGRDEAQLITASDTVVRVTPARKLAAATMDQTPGITQAWPKGTSFRQWEKIDNSGLWTCHNSTSKAAILPTNAPQANVGMNIPAIKNDQQVKLQVSGDAYQVI